jgi:hypothetical protein
VHHGNIGKQNIFNYWIRATLVIHVLAVLAPYEIIFFLYISFSPHENCTTRLHYLLLHAWKRISGKQAVVSACTCMTSDRADSFTSIIHHELWDYFLFRSGCLLVLKRNEAISPWIIFSSIVRLLEPYGMSFSIFFGCLGWCLVVLLTCLLVGGLVGKLRVLCGRWCLPVSCGVFGGKEMTEVLSIMRDRRRSLSLLFFTLFTWTTAFVFIIFLFFSFFLPRRFLLYTPYILE